MAARNTAKGPGDATVHSGSPRGLSSEEANVLLQQYGFNEIAEKKKNYYLMFLGKFYGPVQLVLWLVALLSYVLGRKPDFYIVVALLAFNAVVGFVEEYRADVSVAALKGMLASKARVFRDGEWSLLEARLLVPGDVMRVRMGDIVPADALITACEDMEIDESVITGESLPIEKQTGETAFQGSTVRRGEATCTVSATGFGTKYGKTAKLVELANAKSHLEEVIMRLVKYLTAGDAVVVAVMFTYGFFMLHTGLGILLPFLLVVFIASVPVALSAAFTVAMALGTEKLAKRSILVTKLEAIENTATMNVLCVDKTGTLTENKISVKKVVPFGCSENEVIKCAAEASRAEDNDPIDNAIIAYAKSAKLIPSVPLHFLPFTPSTKRTEATVGRGSGAYLITKGATSVILEMVAQEPGLRKKSMDAINAMARNGFRSMAVAKKVGNGAWTLLGIIALYDPPRKDARSLLGELRNLGISLLMLTGDNVAVANEIATEVDIKGNIVDMAGMKPEERKRLSGLMLRKTGGFANVYPEDKYSIVKAMQKMGMMVGMTGDGVNDAPALKQAEVGIAVSNATDVAKSAAALVLTENGIGVITDAVKESRRIFERMAVYSMAKVAKVFQIVGFVAITFLAMGFIPITPFMLILLIFTNDLVNISISTDRAGYSTSPDAWNMRSIFYSSGSIGAALIVQALLLLPLGLGILKLSALQLTTTVFLLFDVSDKLTILNIREKRAFWKSRPSTPLVASSLLGVAVGILISYYGIVVPSIPISAILVVMALSVAFLFINDLIKKVSFRRFGITDSSMQH